MVTEDNETIWITHEDGLTVLNADGTFAVWGNKYTDMETERTIISGDPIVGSKGMFPANAIDISEDYFYLTQNGKYGLTVARDLLNQIPNSQVHFMAIGLTEDDYWKQAVNIWKLQQLLYPQILVAVFQNEGSEKSTLISLVYI
ncbi:MAG: hypothetical protein R2883_07655 [Caldisericia bacterium]